MSKCEKQGHRYEKFDDRSIFCERCGDQKFLTSAYQPTWTYWPPIYPGTIPWPTYPHWIVTSGTITTSGTAIDWNSNQSTPTDQATYTFLSDGSQPDA